jgi:ribosomal RNA-processing protein 9
LQNIGAIPVRGFVNSIAIAKSAKFIVAGVGQEPRLGRWLRDPAARNGILIHPLDLCKEAESDE